MPVLQQKLTANSRGDYYISVQKNHRIKSVSAGTSTAKVYCRVRIDVMDNRITPVEFHANLAQGRITGGGATGFQKWVFANNLDIRPSSNYPVVIHFNVMNGSEVDAALTLSAVTELDKIEYDKGD